MKVLSLAAAIFLILILPGLAGAVTVLTVDGLGSGNYTTIQAAIDAASSPDYEIHVATGTYTENVVMKDGVDLLGGYSAADWSRDPTVNVATIDANGTGSAVTAADAKIDGFAITGCAATGIVAGVKAVGCSPTITNNIITGNGRHGIYVEGGASPVIEKNLITSNSYYAIYCYSFGGAGTPLIYNNTMHANRRGIQLYFFSPVIKNNIITSCTEYGIANVYSSAPVVNYNDLWSNTQGNYYGLEGGAHDKSSNPLYAGGGDYRLSTSPAVSPCIDAGVDVGLPYNYLPDMGAYESPDAQPVPWPPDGLRATPLSAAVMLDWLANAEPDIAGYKVSYGNVSGSYIDTLDVGNVTEYDVRSLINGATYFFAVQAYDTVDNTSGYSSEVSATPTAGTRELPHYSWDASFGGGGDCGACHFTNTGGGELLPPDFDYRYSTSLCLSCHNLTGTARGKVVYGASSHPVYINVTTGVNRLPAYGNITGRYSNRMGDHLKDGGIIVCNTCHNIMEKTEDPGRTWEFTTFTFEDSWKTFALQNGGWYWYDYLQPELYTSQTLVTAPTYIKDRREYRSGLSLSNYNPDAGKITFTDPFFDYAYVTLPYQYLRVGNSGNAMCLDCHVTATHRTINCLTCHENHGYVNRYGVRPRIKTPNSGIRNVVFTSVTGPDSFADGDNVYDGICEVCHTQTRYHRNNGTGFANHSSGVNESGSDCTACHAHQAGFARP
ncbi:MAG: right-handed parallel beta-helix repeat-containing protein [Nitrospirae bacterium]|nr:right-handed parallel beta-helix repeat-containing protein [Nitrospirota bacterium]